MFGYVIPLQPHTGSYTSIHKASSSILVSSIHAVSSVSSDEHDKTQIKEVMNSFENSFIFKNIIIIQNTMD